MQGLDPSTFSDMLIVTTPRFLGYSFNPVSYFHFYDPSGELGAVVYEIKNTFGERHVYVLSPQHAAEEGIKVRKGFTFADRHEKKFHISPFNHRSGYYEFQMVDPYKDGAVDVHMSVFDGNGKKAMTAGVKSEGEPVDLLSVSTRVMLWMVVTWGFTQFMAIPRTFFEAFKIYRKGIVPVYQRPEPLASSGARSETALER